MKPADKVRSGALPDVRASAIARPPMAPPMKAMSDSASVQQAASRMNRNSGVPKVRMVWRLSVVGVIQPPPIDQLEERREGQRQHQVDDGNHDVYLEAAKGLRLQVVGH